MLNGPQFVTAAPPEPMPARPVSLPTQPGQLDTSSDTPDVVIAVNQELTRTFAVFQVDPVTKKMQVSVVDDEGRLVRLIPPESVAQMVAAMAAYPRR